MQVEVLGGTIELVKGDISLQQVDAIINAANSSLAGGGGVDGAIHRRGGPEIMQETDVEYPDGCPTGSAVVSRAGNLAAKFVIHAVGPIWRGGNHGESELLAKVHRESLDRALERNCQTLAFPAISTGVYRYPLEQAARVAILSTIEFLGSRGGPSLVRFILFDTTAFKAYSQALEELTAS